MPYEWGPGAYPSDGGLYELQENQWYCCLCSKFNTGGHPICKDHLKNLAWYFGGGVLAVADGPPPHPGRHGGVLPVADGPQPHPAQHVGALPQASRWPPPPPPPPHGRPMHDVATFQAVPGPVHDDDDRRRIEDRLGVIEERLTAILGSLSLLDSIEDRLGSIEVLTARQDGALARLGTTIEDRLMARQDGLMDRLGSIEDLMSRQDGLMGRLGVLAEVVTGIDRQVQDIEATVQDIHSVTSHWWY